MTRLVEVGELNNAQQAYITGIPANADHVTYLQGLLNEQTRSPAEKADIQKAIQNEQRGLVQITVSNLPKNVVANSLFVEAATDCVPSGVSLQTVSKPAADTKTFDDALKHVAADIAANKLETQALTDRKSMLATLEKFLLAPATITFTKYIYDIDQSQRLADFLTAQRRDIVDQENRLANVLFGLNASKDDLTAKRTKQLAMQKMTPVLQAVVPIDKQQPIVHFKLRYLVTKVSWSPSYNLSVSVNDTTFKLNRIAMIQQESGEDWLRVNLTLSLKPPLMVAAAPTLTPFESQNLRFNLTPNMLKGIESGQQATIKARSLAGSADIGAAKNLKPFSPLAGTVNSPKQASLDGELNLEAAQRQMLEIVNRQSGDAERADEEKKGAPVPDPSLSGFVDPNGAPFTDVTLGSMANRQVLSIDDRPADLTGIDSVCKIAIPVLSPYVYDQVKIRNDTPRPLPPGPMAVYRDGRLVGQVEIREVLSNRRFELGLGIDPRLSTKRELRPRDDTPGDITFKYRLSVKNSSSARITVTLTDRLPTIKGYDLVLIDPGRPAGQRDRTDNIIKWTDFSVNAQSQAQVDYSFTLRRH